MTLAPNPTLSPPTAPETRSAPERTFARRVADIIKWRVIHASSRAVKRLFGRRDEFWSRVVMDRETAGYVRGLGPADKTALEISGLKWKDFGFAAYRSVEYPEFDVCGEPLDETFDVVIAEQVLEHVLRPYQAVRNMKAMLKPGGVLVLTTPFLIHVHDYPIDCSRWTETGIKYLLAECGFDLADIETGSWGNLSCVTTNFRNWCRWNAYFHSLENDPKYPIHVWCFARNGEPASG